MGTFASRGRQSRICQCIASAHRRCDFGFAIRHSGCSAQSFVNFTRSLGRDCQATRWRGAFAWSIVLAMEAVGVYMGMRHEETLIEELPWTSIEELVVDKPASRVPSVIRGVIALVAIASIASSLAQAVKVAGQSIDKVEKFMV